MDCEKITQYCGGLPFGLSLLCLTETGSTNDEVKRRAAGGGDWAVVSGSQTAGRGRLGRGFDSRPGGLYLSLSFRPRRPLSEVLHLTALTALAVCDAVESVCSVRPGVKWPNDLLIDGKKFCGILTEAENDGNEFFIVTGVGINIKNPLSPELTGAGNLETLCGFAPEPERLAAEVITRINRIFSDAFEKKAELLARYESVCVTVGKSVRALSGDRPVEGVAVGIDENAALLVKEKNGNIVTIFSGEATLNPDSLHRL